MSISALGCVTSLSLLCFYLQLLLQGWHDNHGQHLHGAARSTPIEVVERMVFDDDVGIRHGADADYPMDNSVGFSSADEDGVPPPLEQDGLAEATADAHALATGNTGRGVDAHAPENDHTARVD